MVDQENNSPVATPSEYANEGIDFSGVNALANNDYKRESGFTVFMNGLLEGLLKLGLFLFGIILDVLKALLAIVVGLVTGIYRGIRKFALYLRSNHRKFCEMDKWGKASFFCQGLGQIKYGQVGQGVVFMVVEVAFIAFFAAMGVTNIINLINIAAVARQSHVRLILGILTIIIIAAYWLVWQFGVNATYDAYQILHNFDFRDARENAIKVLHAFDNYADDNGTSLVKLGRGKVYRLMRTKYGYSKLSARYISYVDFKRVIERRANPFRLIANKISDGFYAAYKKWRDHVKAGKWSSAFAAFLEWKPAKKASRYGFAVVLNELESGLLVFHHTYDKYNDYHAVLRDTESLIRVFENPEDVMKCVYAEDAVSIRNGIKPISRGKALPAKEILPRIVGFYEVTFDVGKVAAAFVAKALKGGVEGAKRAIAAQHDSLVEKRDLFVYENNEKAKKEAAGVTQAYQAYDSLSETLLRGKKEFLASLQNSYGIGPHYGEMIYDDYAYAKKAFAGNDEAIRANLAAHAENFAPVAELIDTYEYHGQPTTFKKQVKMYADEKFAVTILALPTIGAILTCVLPLVFSIIIAFTNWDRYHTAYRFDWNLEAWGNVFGLGESGGTFVTTFTTLLLWTIIWAFFATFTNYIFGIILALLINKKGIKLKSLWRTCFVITIAIPQFITLLVMALLFHADGPINTWFASMGWAKVPFLGEIKNGTAAFAADSGDYVFIKMMIVLINMWVGIPYTMLSTSGILMNIPEDLYESAQIDGASAWTQFWKITMPYVVFVTGPSLLTTFIGNLNNFNVIYFLTGGEPRGQMDALSQWNAGHTDLFITWLYKLTVNNSDYAMGSIIGIMMFVVCAFFSLIMYKRMGSVQNEEAFQ